MSSTIPFVLLFTLLLAVTAPLAWITIKVILIVGKSAVERVARWAAEKSKEQQAIYDERERLRLRPKLTKDNAVLMSELAFFIQSVCEAMPNCVNGRIAKVSLRHMAFEMSSTKGTVLIADRIADNIMHAVDEELKIFGRIRVPAVPATAADFKSAPNLQEIPNKVRLFDTVFAWVCSLEVGDKGVLTSEQVLGVVKSALDVRSQLRSRLSAMSDVTDESLLEELARRIRICDLTCKMLDMSVHSRGQDIDVALVRTCNQSAAYVKMLDKLNEADVPSFHGEREPNRAVRELSCLIADYKLRVGDTTEVKLIWKSLVANFRAPNAEEKSYTVSQMVNVLGCEWKHLKMILESFRDVIGGMGPTELKDHVLSLRRDLATAQSKLAYLNSGSSAIVKALLLIEKEGGTICRGQDVRMNAAGLVDVHEIPGTKFVTVVPKTGGKMVTRLEVGGEPDGIEVKPKN
jgi:hypothetical protein